MKRPIFLVAMLVAMTANASVLCTSHTGSGTVRVRAMCKASEVRLDPAALGLQAMSGPPGPTGAMGATGAMGTAGATGAQGTAGTPGTTGAQGATGAQGPLGPIPSLACTRRAPSTPEQTGYDVCSVAGEECVLAMERFALNGVQYWQPFPCDGFPPPNNNAVYCCGLSAATAP